MEETLRICRDQDVLKEYLKNKEAEEIMFTWLDEQRAKKFEYEEIKQEGRAEGEKIGQNKLGSLMIQLKNLGRTEDAFKAASDEAYRNQLYKDLGIL